MKREVYNKIKERVDELERMINGGKGSGNFGHSGRPGEVGGSGDGRGLTKEEKIKGGTKAEKQKIKDLLTSYYSDRGMDGIFEDAEAASIPHEDGSSSYAKAKRLVQAGNFGVSYEDAFEDLKSIYGDSFKESTYKTKSGDWKIKGNEAYVWTIYKDKLAKVIADEMDKWRFNHSLDKKIENLSKLVNGGKGSGNFGHKGRPGEVGGSGSGSGTAKSDKSKDVETAYSKLDEASEKEKKAWDALQSLGDRPSIPETDKYDRTGRQQLLAISERGYYDDKRSKLEAEYEKFRAEKKQIEKQLSEEDLHEYYMQEASGERPYQKEAGMIKDVQKALKPTSDGYTREITGVKYNPKQDSYEAKATVRIKDDNLSVDELWRTTPGKNPKDRMSWFRDNSPTHLEELADRIDRAHGKH